MTPSTPKPPNGKPHRRGPADRWATVGCAAALGVAVPLSLLVVMLFPMATDPCASSVPCDLGALTTAFTVSLTALVLGPLVALIGGIIAARRRWPVFPWPLLGLVIVLLGMAVGLHFTTLIVP